MNQRAAALLLALTVATGAWWLSGRSQRRALATHRDLPVAAAAGVDLPARHQAEAARVAEAVSQHNQAGDRDRAGFVAAGWQLVDAPPPDSALTSYDPALLGAREDELAVQLGSTVPSPAQAAAVAEIARRTHSVRTRVLAVEALGRVKSDDAQHALLSLIPAFAADDPARQAIAPLLRPQALDAPLAAELAVAIDGAALTPVERDQIAFTLALVGARDGMELDAETLAQLRPRTRALLDAAHIRALTALAPHTEGDSQ